MQARATPPTPDDCPGPEACAPARDLVELIDAVEQSVRMLASGHVTLTEQMAELHLSVVRQDKRMDKLVTDLQANSQATQETMKAALEIKDVVTTGRTMGRLVRWAAPTLVALAVALGVIKGWAVDIGQAISASGGRK